MTTDLNHVSVGLGDSACDGADASLSHELDTDLGLLVDLVEVVDELGKILNGVNVVVRRGTDQRDAWLGAPESSNVGGNLLSWELASLPGSAPWAIFISRCCAFARKCGVTPTLPLASCLMAEVAVSPFSSRSK